MVLDFNIGLPEALARIELFEQRNFTVYEEEQERTYHSSDDILERYAEAKARIVEVINEKFGTSYNLKNWIDKKEDEVAGFLNEAGSNVLANSSYKCPYAFHLWIGRKGFIISVEQKGRGFDAVEVARKGIKENKGGGFAFYRRCKGIVFFDDVKEARKVYLMDLSQS
ncbi:hypothetical protein COV20_00240 [Candidatus Woesearchaeota archaeon CG10_big_fil_rev_8_21_14_0_10_45_16]|nr:MAG: hypothetical protein COV20_00240 [Candidatus Woesearchaeota archaeon CG10_big_fil_rev_8_21_14_0_10_45_16]